MYRRRTEGGREGQEREEGGRERRDLGRCSVWGVQDVLGIHALLSCWRLWRGSLAISGTVCRVAALAGAFVGGRPGERWGACIDTGTRGHDCGPCFALAGQVGPPSLVHAAAVPPPLLSPLQATSAACAPGLCSWVAVPAVRGVRGCAPMHQRTRATAVPRLRAHRLVRVVHRSVSATSCWSGVFVHRPCCWASFGW